MRTVSAVADVEAGEPSSLELTCPRGFVALSGSSESGDEVPWALASVPKGLDGWRFRLRAERTGPVRASLLCARTRIPNHYRVGTRAGTFHDTLTVEALADRDTTVRCPRGFMPTGYGWEEHSDEAPPGVLSRATVLPGRYEFSVGNYTPGSAKLQVYARCLERRVTARRGKKRLHHTFRMRRRAARHLLSAGQDRASARCRRGSVALAAGFATPYGVSGSGYIGSRRTGSWRFLNLLGREAEGRTYLSCLSVQSRFRR